MSLLALQQLQHNNNNSSSSRFGSRKRFVVSSHSLAFVDLLLLPAFHFRSLVHSFSARLAVARPLASFSCVSATAAVATAAAEEARRTEFSHFLCLATRETESDRREREVHSVRPGPTVSAAQSAKSCFHFQSLSLPLHSLENPVEHSCPLSPSSLSLSLSLQATGETDTRASRLALAHSTRALLMSA